MSTSGSTSARRLRSVQHKRRRNIFQPSRCFDIRYAQLLKHLPRIENMESESSPPFFLQQYQIYPRLRILDFMLLFLIINHSIQSHPSIRPPLFNLGLMTNSVFRIPELQMSLTMDNTTLLNLFRLL